MKKVVVVCGEHKEVFEGENLRVTIERSLQIYPALPNILKVWAGDRIVASFTSWNYWRETK